MRPERVNNTNNARRLHTPPAEIDVPDVQQRTGTPDAGHRSVDSDDHDTFETGSSLEASSFSPAPIDDPIIAENDSNPLTVADVTPNNVIQLRGNANAGATNVRAANTLANASVDSRSGSTRRPYTLAEPEGRLAGTQFASARNESISSAPQRDPTVQDNQNGKYADLSQDAYQVEGRGDIVPEGYERIDVQDNTDSGLAGSAYYNEATNELVIAYRGTEATAGPKDLEADIALFTGQRNPQTADALAYADEVQRLAQAQGLEVDKITYTGHSLGGGLATEVAALRSIQNGEENQAVVFEAPGSQRSLEGHLGRRLTSAELSRLQGDQINYRTDTPISGPNNPVSQTRHHTSSLVNLDMQQSPSKGVLDDIYRDSGLGWPEYTLQQHNLGRIRDIVNSDRGVGLDPNVTEAEAERFRRAFESTIVPTRNPFGKLGNLQRRNSFPNGLSVGTMVLSKARLNRSASASVTFGSRPTPRSLFTISRIRPKLCC
ncbi:MAG: DUF6792 domain-containing protein [Myxococcota bacterium]